MVSWVGEFDFIRAQLAPLSEDAQGSANLTDDGAVLDLGPGERLAVTADTLIESRHFPKAEDPALAARKALRVNLSDLAAMGATPFAYTTSVVWPHNDIEVKAAGFVDGLRQDQQEFGVRLIGGDTTRANAPWTLSITAFGRLPEGPSLRRNRAQMDDVLVVTGTIGDSGLGLGLVMEEWVCGDEDHAAFLLDRYRLPQPRIGVGQAARGLANAAIDVSDGLLSEARHLAVESGLQAVVDLDRVLLSPAATAWLKHRQDRSDGLLELVTSGDDYELLMAVPQIALPALRDRCLDLGVQVSVIGHLCRPDGREPLEVRAGSQSLKPARLGFTQF